jgi:hypothetical protein
MVRLGQNLLQRVRDWIKPITDTPVIGALTDITVLWESPG